VSEGYLRFFYFGFEIQIFGFNILIFRVLRTAPQFSGSLLFEALSCFYIKAPFPIHWTLSDDYHLGSTQYCSEVLVIPQNVFEFMCKDPIPNWRASNSTPLSPDV